MATRILGWMVVMLLVAFIPAWWLIVRTTNDDAAQETIARARAISTTLATSPLVLDAALTADPPKVLAEPIEEIRAANDVLFVIALSPQGVRWTHPDPTHIGGDYIGDLTEAKAGGVTVDEFTGSLGRSYRVVVPAYRDGRMVAMVSTGISVESVNRIGWQRALQLLPMALASLVLGVIGIWVMTGQVRRQTRGLGPIELGRLYSYHEALLHSVRAGLVLIGRDGTVVLCNDDARELTGTPEVRPGQPVSGLWLDAELHELMTSGRDCAGEMFVEDGRTLVVTQVRAVFEGEDLGWVTTLRDRTDLVRLTGELDSLKSFSEMLRSRAHEADNRLHTVIMLVELGRGEEAIEFATETIAQSQALVDAVTASVEDAPVAALLLGKHAQAEERGVTLRLAEDLELPSTGVAAVDLLVILGNLVDNGIDASAEAEEPRWVEVGGRVEGRGTERKLTLTVTDSGPGIPPDSVEQAFQRGWSTKTPRADERPHGRGIGLSLVSGAVRRMGGSLSVSSTPSRFTVRIPLQNTSQEKAP